MRVPGLDKRINAVCGPEPLQEPDPTRLIIVKLA